MFITARLAPPSGVSAEWRSIAGSHEWSPAANIRSCCRGNDVSLEETDIAFAASAIGDGNAIDLYYSVANRHVMRAKVRRR